MNQLELETYLDKLPLGGIRFFQKTASTNDDAAEWIKTGCPDLALVLADEQTGGRGRGEHKWYTPAGSGLAFSVILRATGQINRLLEYQYIGRLNGLGALAVCLALQKEYQLPAEIKWPNDILVNGKKLSGVLAEPHWLGNELTAVILGIGINVATISVPPTDWDTLNPYPFPAVCVESLLGASVSRWDLLYAVLCEFFILRDRVSEPEFLQIWQNNLAFRDEWVQIISSETGTTPKIGRIIALDDDGALQIQEKTGELTRLRNGEIQPSDPPFGGFRLRPVDSCKK